MVDLVERFVAKAIGLGARVEQVADEAGVVRLLGDVAGEAGSVVGTARLAMTFAAVGQGLGEVPAERTVVATEVVTAGVLGVAETGSVLVGEDNQGRGACMLAERLWLLLRRETVVATLDQALAKVGELVGQGAPYVTLMSGPSRTADIERVLTIGVHGPRELVIVLVGSATDVSAASVTAGAVDRAGLQVRAGQMVGAAGALEGVGR